MASGANTADRLEQALEAMMADPNAALPPEDTHLHELLEIASELVRRPAPEFRAQLKAELARSEALTYRVEPYLQVQGAGRLLDFLRQAFDADELSRDVRADGSVVHAEVRIGDSLLGVGDAVEDESAPMPTAIHLYVPDVDAVYARALAAGATSTQPVTEQPYGDREGGVRDRFGNNWYIGTHRAGRGSPEAPHVPAGLHTVNSYLHPLGTAALIDFLERAFGAEAAFRHEEPKGFVAHAKVRVGESVVEMGEAHGPYQPMPTVYHLYVNDTDAAYRRAIAAGGVSLGAPADRPWGYRNAGIADPSGNQWWLSAPIEAPAAASVSATLAGSPAERQGGGVTPFLVVREVQRTVDFLRGAFGAELVLFDRGGDPPHDHAEVRIGGSLVMMGEAVGDFAPTTSAFYLDVADVTAAYERALRAGATSLQEPRDMPWGHRMAHIVDPLGNSWFLASPRP